MTVNISNPIIVEYLYTLQKSGLYGHSTGDVARRLIEQQLQLLIKEKSFLFASTKSKGATA